MLGLWLIICLTCCEIGSKTRPTIFTGLMSGRQSMMNTLSIRAEVESYSLKEFALLMLKDEDDRL